ncbi:MAG: DNA glycosylase [Agathobaculum sp.]|uniref:DNA-3-methyladenine glycosylase family protein n=1 Tax=Agathobaculum sp. TaxID=2048138 RepID=UPI002A7FA667|nr:DNA glycosylase [Agathobaculum sp.]MDY3711875.1 DNA glycosylase [Agathobaculum sp.]
MIERIIEDFDIGQIARSGQCFRFRPLGEGRWSLIAYGRYLELTQRGQTVCFDCDADEFDTVWRPYFDLDADYGRYKCAVGKRDRYLQGAVAAGWGLRILRQELWETIVCFIISQQNNIARITKCVENLCLLFGETCYNIEGQAYHAFPTAARLAACTADDLAAVRLGYRARYIVAAAQQVASGEVDLDAIGRMRYPRAKAALMQLTGVGVKVAECICLFALHHTAAFPVDTHIRQMLDAHYPKGFPLSRYRGFAGVMQQYAFFYELQTE